MIAIAVITVLGGLLIFLVSLPLVFRKVPMNQLYGIRTRASFESAERWYDINAYGGRQMAAWSWLITATGAIALFLSPKHFVWYAWTDLAVTLLAVLVPVARTLRWSRKR